MAVSGQRSPDALPITDTAHARLVASAENLLARPGL
jgi:hypothetical protein